MSDNCKIWPHTEDKKPVQQNKIQKAKLISSRYQIMKLESRNVGLLTQVDLAQKERGKDFRKGGSKDGETNHHDGRQNERTDVFASRFRKCVNM